MMLEVAGKIWEVREGESLLLLLLLLLSRLFFKTQEISFRFLTANKVRELQRMVPPVSAELSKT